MINREELVKMIENGETVYFISDDNDIVGINLFPAMQPFKVDYKSLYKTKEESQWVLDTHATREEKFCPPTWEQFISKGGYYNTRDKNGRLMELVAIEYTDKSYIDLILFHKTQECHREYSAELSKENYEKAVMLAKKLFLGEQSE